MKKVSISILFSLFLLLLCTTCRPLYDTGDLEGGGLLLGVPEADSGSVEYIPAVKRDFGDPDYPGDDGLIRSVGTGSALKLTGDPTGDLPTLIDNGDGTTTMRGKIFIETGSETNPHLALNGSDLIVDASGNVEGTAELPVPGEGPFEGWSWNASTLARVMNKTGAEIKEMLEDGDEDSLPLQDNGEYFLFILDGNIQAIGNDNLEFEIPEIPNIPSAGVRMVLDVSDPMFYFDFSASEGFLEEEEDDSGSADDGSDSDGTVITSGDTRNPVLRGFSAFAALDGRGFGFSTQGLIALERNVLWPFNADLEWDSNGGSESDIHLLTDEYGNRTSPAEDSLSFGGNSYTFQYGDQTLDNYPDGEDDEPDEIPILLNSHIYMKGSVDFTEVMGIPLEISGDGAFRLDPAGTLTGSLSAGDPDVPFRAGLNGTLSISEIPVPVQGQEEKQNLLDWIPIITLPDLGYASVMVEHSDLHNRAYFSAVLGDENLTFGDFFDFSKLGDLPGADFLESFDSDFLSEVCVPVGGEANFSGFFEAPPDDFGVEFRFNSVYFLNFSRLVNQTFGETILPDFGLDFQGDFIFGYPAGLFWKGDMALESGFLGLSMDGNTTFEGWLASADDWGLGFDGDLNLELLDGLGEIALAEASLNFSSSELAFSGGFSVPGLMESVTLEGGFFFDPFDFQLDGSGDITLLGIPMLDMSVGIGYSTGILLSGYADLFGASDLLLKGTYNAVNSQFSLTGEASITIPGSPVELADAALTLSNSGFFVAGSLDVPGLSEIVVGGKIQVNGDDVEYEFFGHGDIEICDSYSIAGADVIVKNDGIFIDGSLYLPYEGDGQVLGVEVSGHITNDSDLLLEGRGNIKLGTTTLAGAAVKLMGNLGKSPAGSAADVSGEGGDPERMHISVSVNYNLFDLATIKAAGEMGLLAVNPYFFADLEAEFKAGKEFSYTFSRLGFDITFGAGADVTVTVLIGTGGAGFELHATVSWEYPWVEVDWVEECAGIGALKVCLDVPQFDWTTEESFVTLNTGADLSIDSSGITVKYKFPVIGTKTLHL